MQQYNIAQLCNMTLTPQPLLVPWSRKSRATPLRHKACTELQYLYKGAPYFTYLMGTVELIGNLCLGAAFY